MFFIFIQNLTYTVICVLSFVAGVTITWLYHDSWWCTIGWSTKPRTLLVASQTRLAQARSNRKQHLTPWKLPYPLKIDGCKMKIPFKKFLCIGRSYIFWGGLHPAMFEEKHPLHLGSEVMPSCHAGMEIRHASRATGDQDGEKFFISKFISNSSCFSRIFFWILGVDTNILMKHTALTMFYVLFWLGRFRKHWRQKMAIHLNSTNL